MSIQEAVKIVRGIVEFSQSNTLPLPTHSQEEAVEAFGVLLAYAEQQIKFTSEVESAVENWHEGRRSDEEVINSVNQSLVDIGLLSFWNDEESESD